VFKRPLHLAGARGPRLSAESERTFSNDTFDRSAAELALPTGVAVTHRRSDAQPVSQASRKRDFEL